MPYYLDAEHGVTGDSSRLLILHSYTYGVAPDNKHLTVAYSDDEGLTWCEPQVHVYEGTHNTFAPKIAAYNNYIVVVFIKQVYSDVYYAVSSDNGETWSAPAELFSLAADEEIPQDHPALMDLKNYGPEFSLVYPVYNSTEDSTKVFLTEFEVDTNYVTSSKTTDEAEETVMVFPNPADDEVMAVLPETTGSVLITLVDLQGRMMHRSIYRETDRIILNLSDIEPGIYIMRVRAAGSLHNHRLVIN